MKSNSIFSSVYTIVKCIPKGKAATYGSIADYLGINPRVVGYALHANPDPDIIPCHRVVFANGSLAQRFAFGGPDAQRSLLEDEAVKFSGNRISEECLLRRLSDSVLIANNIGRGAIIK